MMFLAVHKVSDLVEKTVGMGDEYKGGVVINGGWDEEEGHWLITKQEAPVLNFRPGDNLSVVGYLMHRVVITNPKHPPYIFDYRRGEKRVLNVVGV